MPPPIHKLAMPFFASRRTISCSSVTRMRQPDAPIGWPIIDRWPPTSRLMIRPCTLGSRPRDLMELRVHANADREDRMCKLVGIAQKTRRCLV